MASWFQNQFKKAEELFEAVDQTAKSVTVLQQKDPRKPGKQGGPRSAKGGTNRTSKDDASQPAEAGVQPVSRSSSFQRLETNTDLADAKLNLGDDGAAVSESAPASEAEGTTDLSEAEQKETLGAVINVGRGAEGQEAGKEDRGSDTEEAGLGPEGTFQLVQKGAEGAPEIDAATTVLVDGADAASVLDVNGDKVGEDGAAGPDTPLENPETTSGDGMKEALGAANDDDQNHKPPQEVDEVQGSLGKVSTSGQTKEARLARICEKLQKRVAEYKEENEQLEEMLEQSRTEQSSMEAEVKRLQQEVSSAHAGVGAVESSLSTALAAKNAELENLTVALEGAKRQAAMAEGRLAAMQANSEALTRGRDMTETKMLQALREELTLAEKRLDEERAAHTASRQAAASRETELENSMSEGITALARMQRTVDERNQKVADMEHKVSMLEVECSALNQELQEAEVKLRREFTRANSVELDAQVQQINAWKEEAERARRAQREAEKKFSDVEAEAQKLRVETTTLRREQDSSSAQAQAALEKRFRELTEMLYSKQTQVETLSSEKAAAVLQLEKETRRFQEYKAQTERSLRSRQNMIAAEEDVGDMQSLEHSLANYDIKLGKVNTNSIRTAAKFLDFGTISAGRFLWRRPLARLGFLFYLVCVHGFIMYLLHRLQIQAERSLAYGAQDYAAAAGLVKPSLSTGKSLPGQ